MQRIVWGVLGVLGITLVGCAVGTQADDLSTGELDTVPIEAGADGSSVKLPPPSTAPANDDAGAPGDASADVHADAGSGGADAGAGGGGGGGGALSCNSLNTCPGASDLGSVSGDTGSGSTSVQGATSEWFTIRVTENDSGVFGVPLKLTATLSSPAGANFDVYVYVPGADTRECAAVSASSTSTSSFDSASVTFGETGTFSNGVNDDRTVTVEVRHVSGTCAAGAKWTLNLYGNQ